MSSHKILPFQNGFFSRSMEFWQSIGFFFFKIILLGYFFYFNLQLFFLFLGMLIAFSTIYFLKLKRGEYVYFVRFFSVPFVYFLITPLVFLQLEIIIPVIFLTPLFLFPKQSFRYLDFPISLFFSIFTVSLSLLLKKIHLFDFLFKTQKFSFAPFEKITHDLTGIFFFPDIINLEANNSMYSILENYGSYLPIFLIIIFLFFRKSFIWDLLLLLLLSCSIMGYYSWDNFLFLNQILTYLTIWYFLYLTNGLNFRALYPESILSALIVLLFSIFIDPNLYPPILLIVIFFVFRSILSLLKEKRIFQDRGILKTGLK